MEPKRKAGSGFTCSGLLDKKCARKPRGHAQREEPQTAAFPRGNTQASGAAWAARTRRLPTNKWHENECVLRKCKCIKTKMRYHTAPIRMATTKQTRTPPIQKMTSESEDVEKLGPLSSAGGKENGAATVKNSTVVPPKIKQRTTT